jgi:2-polyprenyl-3-methyl-5-hydroxy-6-metoxy-1,4-benzoquinol methylase
MAYDYSSAAAFEERWRRFWALERRPRRLAELPRWLLRLADRRLLWTGEREYIDRVDLPDSVREEVIALVEWTSRALAIGRLAARWLRPLALEVHRRERRPVRILDVGTGRGGIILRAARSLARWGGAPVECAGLDHNPRYVELAREAGRAGGQPDVRFFVGNAFDLALETGAYDILITNWMIHHLSPTQVFRMVQEFDRVAAHGMLLLDVSRSFVVVAGALPATLLLSEPRRHDALITLRRGYLAAELEFILAEAGVAHYVRRLPMPLGLPQPPGASLFGGLRPV